MNQVEDKAPRRIISYCPYCNAIQEFSLIYFLYEYEEGKLVNIGCTQCKKKYKFHYKMQSQNMILVVLEKSE